MNRLIAGTLLSLLFCLAGCGTTPPAADGSKHAECLVCKHNADLACVDVVVEGNTPHCSADGKTYYFCSEGCCRKFQQNPAKYTGK
ncbi:YHS domain-containing protein [Humisphaera borealis]|uniref:YHS domain-containing protein n=1 Tax=Humisphaera borealis TaxID=2807512 RepID=A0A7M2WWI7_9BACT|nr:YHS domain-containing protein [Humisphaera borealis]QOV89201.1 YHS domain-containing protein [Humisphaera borealis]